MYGMESQPKLGAALQRLGHEPIFPDAFYRHIFGNNLLDQERDSEELKALKEHCKSRVGGYVGIMVYLTHKDKEKNQVERKTITDDLNVIDEVLYRDPSEYYLCLTSPISYVGRARSSDNARLLHALTIEIDDLKVNKDGEEIGLLNLIQQWNADYLPKPTYCVASGTGLHLYYVFEKPISLYSNVSKSLATYKRALTKKLWNRNITNSYKDEQIQYESLYQGFRVVGSRTKAGNGEITTAYLTGDIITPDYLNRFVLDSERITEAYEPTLSLAAAKEKYPEWYEKRIVQGLKPDRWVCNRAVYDWWKKRITYEAAIGHRYYCMMILAIYALKCDIDRDELKQDCKELQVRFNSLAATEEEAFTIADMNDALKAFSDKSLVTYPINSIINRSGLKIEKNKRNGRKQKDHLMVARKMKEVKKILGEIPNDGRPDKKNIVHEWRLDNPDGTKAQCIKETGLAKSTVYKWW